MCWELLGKRLGDTPFFEHIIHDEGSTDLAGGGESELEVAHVT